MTRLRLGLGLALAAACSTGSTVEPAPAPQSVEVAPALATTAANSTTPLQAESADPIPIPIPIPIESFRTLPISRTTTPRTATATVDVEVRVDPEHAGVFEAVIDGHLVRDIAGPAGRRKLARWFNTTFARGLGFEAKPVGYRVLAGVEVDSEVLAEVLTFAAGPNLDGPVEVALRLAGSSTLTAIPIVLAERGVVPIAGPWGTWAAAVEEAFADEAVPLALGDAVPRSYAYRNELSPPKVEVKLGEVQAPIDRSRREIRRIAERHRRELQYCYLNAAWRDPELAGRWQATFTVNADGAPSEVVVDQAGDDEHLRPCLRSIVSRWRFPQHAAATPGVAIAFDLSQS